MYCNIQYLISYQGCICGGASLLGDGSSIHAQFQNNNNPFPITIFLSALPITVSTHCQSNPTCPSPASSSSASSSSFPTATSPWSSFLLPCQPIVSPIQLFPHHHICQHQPSIIIINILKEDTILVQVEEGFDDGVRTFKG